MEVINMTELIICYERPDFFGGNTPAEDMRRRPEQRHIKKAFSYFKKNKNTAIKTNDDENSAGYVLFWESYSDFDNGIVTARKFEHGHFSATEEWKFSVEKARKFFYGLFGE